MDDRIGEHVASVFRIYIRYVRTHEFGCVEVTFGIGLGGEAKYGGCVERDRHPVRDEGMVRRVPFHHVLVLQT